MQDPAAGGALSFAIRFAQTPRTPPPRFPPALSRLSGQRGAVRFVVVANIPQTCALPSMHASVNEAHALVGSCTRRYAACVGCHVRSGCGQSIPSSSIDSWAADRWTVPESACGHTKRPLSSRFAYRFMPSPLHHKILIRSPRRPRNRKMCPEKGSRPSADCTGAASPSMPRRISVTPAASQTRVPVGGAIMPASGSAARGATALGRPCP